MNELTDYFGSGFEKELDFVTLNLEVKGTSMRQKVLELINGKRPVSEIYEQVGLTNKKCGVILYYLEKEGKIKVKEKVKTELNRWSKIYQKL